MYINVKDVKRLRIIGVNMRRQLRSTSIKKIKVRTPSGNLKIHFRRKKPGYKKCGLCGGKIVRKRLRPSELAKLPKVQKRPERPYPHLCSSCMREQIKREIRGCVYGGTNE